MNIQKTLSLLVMGVGFVGLSATIPLTDFDFGCNLHPEHPGSAGNVTKTNDGWKIHYDFSNGGHGMGISITPRKPIWAETIRFDALHQSSHCMCVIVCDSTGQHHRKVAMSAPGEWRKFSCGLSTGWIGHWGGAGDGIVHLPIKAFEINVDRVSKQTKNPNEVGDVYVRNIGYDEADKERWMNRRPNANVVRYQVTDFRPGDVFSAGPRAFFRSDYQSRYDGGELKVDFSQVGNLCLYSEIPIWGQPQELLLTVVAPAEASGLEFALVCRAGGPRVSYECGRLRAAIPGESNIVQTFSIPGFFAEGWRKSNDTRDIPKTPARSKRLMTLVVRRGKAPAKVLRFTPVRLEAVVKPGAAHPPLIAIPPKGESAPEELEVGFLNLGPRVREHGSAVVEFSDWEGRILGRSSARFPTTQPGGRSFARVAFPKVSGELNFVSCKCLFYDDDKRDFDIGGWTTSWTRPILDEGPARKNPDVPWGFGVYVHRSEDRYAYSSGYASPTNEAAIAEMELRAKYARMAGIKWERAEFKPGQANYAKGKYDFTYYDRLLDICDKNGITCLGLWSHYFPGYDKPYTQQCYDDYIGTLEVAAKRYKGRIGAWEIWNEPDISFWTGPKEDYPKLVDAAWDVVKTVDPSMRIVACSTAGVTLPFMDMCISKGMKFDDISIHPYRRDPVERKFLEDLASVTNRSHGNKTWLTEMGWPTGCDNSTYSEREQAAYYARAYMTAAGSGMVHSIYGYNFIDDGFNVLERENNFGILRRDLTPKPAYRAIAKVCRTFDHGNASVNPVQINGNGEAWIFRMGGKSAVWAGRNAMLLVETDGVSRYTNLMDEELCAPAVSAKIIVGPLHPVFIDHDVKSIKEIADKTVEATNAEVEF